MTHILVSSITVHTPYTLVGKILAWIEIFGTALAVRAVVSGSNNGADGKRRRRTKRKRPSTCPKHLLELLEHFQRTL